MVSRLALWNLNPAIAVQIRVGPRCHMPDEADSAELANTCISVVAEQARRSAIWQNEGRQMRDGATCTATQALLDLGRLSARMPTPS
jgi:hypothetical protein